MDQQIQETSTGSQDSVNEGVVDKAPAAPAAEEAPQKTVADKINQLAADKNPNVVPQEPAYTPNIKSPAEEKKIRELYEKAYGLEHVKSERERFRTAHKEVETQYKSLNNGLDQLSGMLEKQDYHGFFQALKIPEQDVLQYALSRVQYRELPPEQRQQLDAQYEAQQRLAYLEQANQELVGGFQEQRVHQRASELDAYIGRPDIAQVVSAFDARVGQPGAFRDEVIRRGQYYASLPDPQDIPVEQAVREILGLVGPIPQAQQAVGDEGQAMEATPAPVVQNQKPVIPNIRGRGTSPAKKVVRSVDDLRKLAQTMTE
jgi:hypothetical protein